jgi:hypothetical protein
MNKNILDRLTELEAELVEISSQGLFDTARQHDDTFQQKKYEELKKSFFEIKREIRSIKFISLSDVEKRNARKYWIDWIEEKSTSLNPDYLLYFLYYFELVNEINLFLLSTSSNESIKVLLKSLKNKLDFIDFIDIKTIDCASYIGEIKKRILNSDWVTKLALLKIISYIEGIEARSNLFIGELIYE